VFSDCYGQVAYGWQLSQKAYVLDNVGHIRTYQRPYVHARTRKPQPTTTITIIEHPLLLTGMRIYKKQFQPDTK